MGFLYGLNTVVMSNFGTMCPIWICNIIAKAGCANKGEQLAVQGRIPNQLLKSTP